MTDAISTHAAASDECEVPDFLLEMLPPEDREVVTKGHARLHTLNQASKDSGATWNDDEDSLNRDEIMVLVEALRNFGEPILAQVALDLNLDTNDEVVRSLVVQDSKLRRLAVKLIKWAENGRTVTTVPF